MSETFGQFFEVVEDINFPSSGCSNNDLTNIDSASSGKKYAVREKEDGSFVGKIIKTMDKINNNQFESTASLASMASTDSMNSMASLQSEDNLANAPNKIFNAVQSLTLNNYGSTNSLGAENFVETKDENGNVITKFLEVVGEFMHNHDQLETPAASTKLKSVASTDSVGEEKEIETVFPKFC